jgi:hypothetical protein
MKKFLIIVGGSTVALISAVALAIVLYAPEGRRLDASSRQYVTHVLDTTMRTWDRSALRAESSDELLAVVPDEKLAQLLQTFSVRLGPIKSYGSPRGESRVNLVPFRRVVTAEYLVPATFEKAEGQVALRLILKGDQWKLLGVNVNSEALLPMNPPDRGPVPVPASSRPGENTNRSPASAARNGPPAKVRPTYAPSSTG